MWLVIEAVRLLDTSAFHAGRKAANRTGETLRKMAEEATPRRQKAPAPKPSRAPSPQAPPTIQQQPVRCRKSQSKRADRASVVRSRHSENAGHFSIRPIHARFIRSAFSLL